MLPHVPDPDADAARQAEDRWASRAKPPGSLGRLEAIAAFVAAAQGVCPPQPLEDARLVVFAGDHGVAARGVSAYPAQVTASMVRAMASGQAAVNVLGRQVGVLVSVLDICVDDDTSDLAPAITRHKVRRGTGSIDVEDAMSPEQAQASFAAGRAVADEAVDSGARLLMAGDMGIGNTTPASALVALLTRSEVVDVVGRGTGVDDAGWMRKAAAVRDAAHRGRSRLGDPIDLLAAVGGPDIAAMAGFLLQAAVRRTPVVLDGLVSTAAALVAARLAFQAPRWYLAGTASTEPAHALALDRLGLHPLLRLDLRLGEGTGALLAVPLVRAGVALLTEMASLAEVTGSSPE